MNKKEGKLLHFWLYYVQIYNLFIFYECGASVDRLFMSEADNSYQAGMTQKRKCLNYYVLFQDCSLSPGRDYMPNWLRL